MPNIEVRIRASEQVLTIAVSNGFIEQMHFIRLTERISHLSKASSPMEVYIERLQELKRSGHASGGLGIYRIAAEGGFTVKAEASENVTVVTAERSVAVGDGS